MASRGPRSRSRPIADACAISELAVAMQLDPEQLAANINAARRLPEFADLTAWWITFCIAGGEPALIRLAGELGVRGGKNLNDAETGWLNAKLPVPNEPEKIVALINEVATAVSASGAALVAIDADSSAQVERSTFTQLWAASP